MKKKYIFFRTDRIGDFLLSSILIKSIKRSDKNSHITVVASRKNFSYIKNFEFIDEVVLFPDTFLSKINFYLSFIFKKFYLIGILDGKKRSIYFSFIVRSKYKILFTYKKFYKNLFNYFFSIIFYDNDCKNKISEIQSFLKFLNFNLNSIDLNTINKNTVLSRNFSVPFSGDYLLLHFDEKWIYNDYIKSYTSIEPLSKNLLIQFFEKIILKTNADLFVSSGKISNKFTLFFKKNFTQINKNIYELRFKNNRIIFFDDVNFSELEKLILNSTLLITCHGAPSHVAASLNKKMIDIIDESEIIFFKKWTAHFRNYDFSIRVNFIDLSKKILVLLDR